MHLFLCLPGVGVQRIIVFVGWGRGGVNYRVKLMNMNFPGWIRPHPRSLAPTPSQDPRMPLLHKTVTGFLRIYECCPKSSWTHVISF